MKHLLIFVLLIGLVGCASTQEKDKQQASEPQRMRPEYVIDIKVQGHDDLSGAYEVDRNSAIRLGAIGVVSLKDMTEEEAGEQLAQTITKKTGREDIRVTVRIIKASYDKVRNPRDLSKLRIGAGSAVKLSDILLKANSTNATIQVNPSP